MACLSNAPSNSLMDSTLNPKHENNERIKSWGTLSDLQHFGGKGACWSSRMAIRTNDKQVNYSHGHARTYIDQTKSWLVCSWSAFVARTNHGQTRIQKTHHDPKLGEATTFPLIIFFVPSHIANTQISFCPRTPKLESWNSWNWELPQFWGPITPP